MGTVIAKNPNDETLFSGYPLFADGTQRTIAVLSQVFVASNPNTYRSVLTTYDTAGNQLAQVTSPDEIDEFDVQQCGVADVSLPDGSDVVLTMRIAHTDAAGVNNAKDTRVLTAWNATAGTQLWSDNLFTTDEGADPGPVADRPVCDKFSTSDSLHLTNHLRDSLMVTSNGIWGLFVYDDSQSCSTCDDQKGGPWAIDLKTGKFRVDKIAQLIAGDYIVAAAVSDDDATADGTVSLLDPATGHRVAQSTNSEWQALIDRNLQGYGFATLPDGSAVMAVTAQADSSGAIPRLSILGLPKMTIKEGPKAPVGFPDPEYNTGDIQLIIDNATGTVLSGVDVAGAAGASIVVQSIPTHGTGWHIADARLCGVKDGKTLVFVNGQLATLDVKTGRQLSYTSYSGTTCPTMLPSGAGVDAAAVTQYLP